jgi:Flp pilus assembly protein TadG
VMALWRHGIDNRAAQRAPDLRHLFLSPFLKDTRGSIAIYFALSAVVFICVTGLAVDAARGYLLKARLSAAVDAAALAGGKSLLDTANREAVTRAFFNANLPAGAMGATIASPVITYAANNTEITVSATASVPTTLMRLMGVNTMNVASTATVSRAISGLDVVFSIDMSWSMCEPCDKIAAAQSAAKEMVDSLWDPFENGSQQQNITVNGTTYSMLNVGVVPWNAKVNVNLSSAAPGYQAFDSSKTTSKTVSTFTNPVLGTTQSRVYYANSSPVPLLEAPQSGWKGCVYARYIDDGNQTNDADVTVGTGTYGGADWMGWEPINPLEGEPQSGSWPSSPNPYNANYPERTATTNYRSRSQNCYAAYWNGKNKGGDPFNLPGDPTNATTLADGTKTVPKPTSRNWKYADPGNSNECTECLARGILPLSSNHTTVTNALNALWDGSNGPGGNTNAPAGLAWAWEVLMPGEPFAEAPVSVPFNRSQAIVLMTDGYNMGNNGDAYKGVFGLNEEAQNNTLHGNLPDGTKNNLTDRLLWIASTIKNSGVKIFVIQYEENDADLTTLLKQVASGSSDPYYYYAPDPASLDDIFRQIASTLSALRIVK